MSKAFEKFLKGKFNLQDSYPSLILGAIIVVILGLLVANYLSRRGQQQEIDMGAATEQQTPAQAIAPRAGSEYTVRENDSLSKISEQVYGGQEFWPRIASVNNVANPNRILVGDKLQLPAKEELQQSTAVLPQSSYRVQKGETFFTIAEKVYGDGSMWTLLHRANGGRRLPNGNPLVYAGSTITVPR